MTTNKPEVQRYDDTGCPEQICRVDTMHESDDGDYILYEDYEALQAECEKLRKDAERYRWLRDPCSGAEHVVMYGRGDYGKGLKSGSTLDDDIDAAMEQQP